ncbi:hypothetical protein Sste5346_010137 [Sporothrix stenoceras]|uniref:Uncharacterized protein n=1 Tax=Sporothrix stenoceras TaxID=5173 RepID=A0ABR3YHB1_9PEZI
MSFFLYFVAFLVTVLASVVAYEQGYADPLIDKFGVYLFKAKAKAEEKELEAEGLGAGKDSLKDQLEGSQQAEDVQLGLGWVGALKMNA